MSITANGTPAPGRALGREWRSAAERHEQRFSTRPAEARALRSRRAEARDVRLQPRSGRPSLGTSSRIMSAPNQRDHVGSKPAVAIARSQSMNAGAPAARARPRAGANRRTPSQRPRPPERRRSRQQGGPRRCGRRARPAVEDGSSRRAPLAEHGATGVRGPGHAEQRRDRGDAPAPLELARNRQPARRTHERTVDDERPPPRGCRGHLVEYGEGDMCGRNPEKSGVENPSEKATDATPDSV